MVKKVKERDINGELQVVSCLTQSCDVFKRNKCCSRWKRKVKERQKTENRQKRKL